MRQWTRPILAILLGVLTVCYLGIVPAQAAEAVAKTKTVITYRGYTLSWSEPDASDLRVVRADGRTESFPAIASERGIRQAKTRVTNASAQQSSEDPSDSCNFVPDSFGLADFTLACDAHDTCYSNMNGISRLDCDTAFLASLDLTCAKAYPDQLALRLTCFTVAGIYFVGVRLFGASFYTGNGSPA
jgi:hypothetical protein